MDRMVVKSRVGADGILQVTVPVGVADANREVQITIEPTPVSSWPPEQWRNLILSTAGSISDPTFLRHEQGEYEQREPLP